MRPSMQLFRKLLTDIIAEMLITAGDVERTVV